MVLRDVDAEIADARVQLAELDRRREVVTQRLADLNRLRASGDTGGRADGGTELSAASKIELFRDLFRGREDVFAVRWENRAKGSSGYVFEASRSDWPALVGRTCKVSTFAVEELGAFGERASWAADVPADEAASSVPPCQRARAVKHQGLDETALVHQLGGLPLWVRSIVAHPDGLTEPDAYRALGTRLVLEEDG